MANILAFQTALMESARPDQFRVQINFPSSLVTAGVAATTASTLLTFQGSLPQSTIQDIEVYYRGKQYHEAGETQFQPWTCQIYNDTTFIVRSALEQWSTGIRERATTGGAILPMQYKSTISIDQLSRSGIATRRYTLYGVYPTEIGEIQLDYGSANQLEMYNCTFVYDYFKVNELADLAAANAVSAVEAAADAALV